MFVQPPLFTPPDVDIRSLRDTERTVLEAIDKLGAVTLRDAGRIVYRLNRRRRPLEPWIAYPSTGRKVLRRLVELGLAEPAGGDRFTRPVKAEAA